MCIRDSNNTEEIPTLQKSGVYKLKSKDWDNVYVGKTGNTFDFKLKEHRRGEGDNPTNSLYARHIGKCWNIKSRK